MQFIFTEILQITAFIINIIKNFDMHIIKLSNNSLKNLKSRLFVSYNGHCLTINKIKKSVNCDNMQKRLILTNITTLCIKDIIN